MVLIIITIFKKSTFGGSIQFLFLSLLSDWDFRNIKLIAWGFIVWWNESELIVIGTSEATWGSFSEFSIQKQAGSGTVDFGWNCLRDPDKTTKSLGPELARMDKGFLEGELPDEREIKQDFEGYRLPVKDTESGVC